MPPTYNAGPLEWVQSGNLVNLIMDGNVSALAKKKNATEQMFNAVGQVLIQASHQGVFCLPVLSE